MNIIIIVAYGIFLAIFNLVSDVYISNSKFGRIVAKNSSLESSFSIALITGVIFGYSLLTDLLTYAL